MMYPPRRRKKEETGKTWEGSTDELALSVVTPLGPRPTRHETHKDSRVKKLQSQ